MTRELLRVVVVIIINNIIFITIVFFDRRSQVRPAYSACKHCQIVSSALPSHRGNVNMAQYNKLIGDRLDLKVVYSSSSEELRSAKNLELLPFLND